MPRTVQIRTARFVRPVEASRYPDCCCINKCQFLARVGDAELYRCHIAEAFFIVTPSRSAHHFFNEPAEPGSLHSLAIRLAWHDKPAGEYRIE